MLEGDRPPELKIAAAQVLGELRPKDAAVVKLLERQLQGGATFLARPLLVALAGIRSAAAIRVLVDQLARTEHADVAAHLLAEIGAPAAAALEAAFPAAGPEARNRIVGILGRAADPAAQRVLELALLDPELGRRAGESLLQNHVGNLSKKDATAFKSRLTRHLRDHLPPQSTAAVLRLLARLDPAGSRANLIRHAGPEFPSMVRSAALEALAEVHLTPKQAVLLLPLLDDVDEVNVAEPAIAVLNRVEHWPPEAVPALRAGLASRRPRLRRFALQAASRAGDPALVAPLLEHLDAADPREQELALAALGANEAAFEPLLKALVAERSPERARRLTAAVVAHRAQLDDAALRSLVEKGARQLAAKDPRGEILLDCAVRARADFAAPLVVDKAVRLRRQRKLPEARALLAFLASGDQLDAEGRYQLALTSLLIDAANGAAHGRDAQTEHGDATMGHLAILVREGFTTAERLCKEQMLRPDDLLRVGRHFSTGVGEERRFAAELLHHLAHKHGKKRAGEEALQTLRAESL